MAIRESDREDLLGEGRNMPYRGQCWIGDVKVIIGFREQGQASMFCGVDPVFQFNSQRELRRAYFRTVRYRTENRCLIAMTRVSRGGKVAFVSESIDKPTEEALRLSLKMWLNAIGLVIDSASWQVVGESTEQFRQRLQDWLANLPDPVILAAIPNA